MGCGSSGTDAPGAASGCEAGPAACPSFDGSADGDPAGPDGAPVVVSDGGDGGASEGGDQDVTPVAGIFDVKRYGALGDGVADDTATIREAIAAADAAGGGIVYFPKGRYRVTGNLSVGSGITLGGEGFQPPGAGPVSALVGSWLVVDQSYLTGAAVTLANTGATLRDMGIWHDQPAPGPGWQPRAFGWAVDMVLPDTLTRDVWLANATSGIHGIGRVTIENVQGEPISTGIQIDAAYDVVRIRRVRFNWTAEGQPVWSSDPSVMSQLGVGIESLRDDNPEIYDVKVSGYATGIHYGASSSGITSKFSMMDTYVDHAARCVTIDGAGTTGKLTRFWGSNCGSTGIWITGAGSIVSAADIDLREIGANAIRVEAASAFFLVNQLTVVDWDKGNLGFPGIEAAVTTATAKVGLYRSFMGGNVQLGGVGNVVTDSNPASSAFNLRVPLPTEVPEDSVTPYAARVDVLAHGALGDGTGDDTAAIQAAMDAAAAAGGGPVVVPAGDYHLKGSLHVPPKVTLVGVGWQGQAAGTQINPADGTTAVGRVFRGANFSIDAANTADVIQLGDNSAVKMIGMRWDQGAVVAGWQPRKFGWAVRVTGTNVSARDLFLLNPTKGIEVASAGAGPVLIDRVFGSPQSIGLHLDTNATVRANDMHFWPFWGLGGAYASVVGPYVEGNAVAFQCDHSAGAEISDAFSILYQMGVLLGQNAGGQVNQDLRLWNADQDVGVRGYVITGPGTQATFANFSAQGDTSQTSPGVTGIWAESSATNASLAAYNGDLRIFTGNAVRSDAAGASVLVNLMHLEGWGRGGAFPVVEGGAVGPEEWMNGS